MVFGQTGRYLTVIQVNFVGKGHCFRYLETLERKFEYIGFANFCMAMSLNESDFLNKADVNIYDERITLNEKMRTKLTLEQKKGISDVMGRFNRFLRTKAENYYRYDIFKGTFDIATGKVGLKSILN